MDTTKRVLAQRIQELRARADLSQESLAHRAGISRAHLSELERGQKEAGIRVLVRLAQALSVEPGDLLKGAKSPSALKAPPRKRRSRPTGPERLGRLVSKLAEGADEASIKRFATVAKAFFPKKEEGRAHARNAQA